MKTANELMVGNYVRHTNRNGSFDVSVIEVLKNGVNVTSKIQFGEWFLRFEEIRPIPITEEWLLKFGFEETYWQESGDFAHWDKDGISWFDKDMKCIIWYMVTDIKQIHSLQNLYAALIGKELTL